MGTSDSPKHYSPKSNLVRIMSLRVLKSTGEGLVIEAWVTPYASPQSPTPSWFETSWKLHHGVPLLIHLSLLYSLASPKITCTWGMEKSQARVSSLCRDCWQLHYHCVSPGYHCFIFLQLPYGSKVQEQHLAMTREREKPYNNKKGICLANR